MNKYKPHVLVAVTLLVLAGIFFAYNAVVYKTEISEFDIKASAADAAGVAPNSHFIVKTTAPLTTQVLEKYIKLIPAVDFSITKVSAAENTFEIIPKDALVTNKVYTIKVDKGPVASHDFSWAYQVKAPFALTSSIPGNKTTDVPLNTGIELYFNRDTILNPDKNIEITPSAPGSFSVDGNMVRFVPSNPLAPQTIYTIKIKSGLTALDTTDTLGSEKIVQFETQQPYSSAGSDFVSFNRTFNEFKPGTDIVLGTSGYGPGKVKPVSTTVYRFDSAQDFTDSFKKIEGDSPWARYSADITKRLPATKKVFTSDVPVNSTGYPWTLTLPQQLPVGYYAAVITNGSENSVTWFQVNPAASFVAFASTKSLFWLKDISSEKNSAGVAITLNGVQVGKTGNDGVALIDTPADFIRKSTDPYYSRYTGERQFFIAALPGTPLVIPFENEYGDTTKLNQNEKWWNYISLNKNIYLPTDTLRFWAITKPINGQIPGEDISVKLTNSFWSEDQENIITYAETTAKVSSYNALTGELSFSNLKPGVYDLTFRKGTEIIGKETISVSAYIKPAYKISLTPDKTAVFAGDSVNFKVKAELFDGTPVTNTSLTYSAYGSSRYAGTVALNTQGEGTFSVTPDYDADQNYWPSYFSIQVRPTKAEEGDIQSTANVFVFGPHIYNTVTFKQTAQNATFTIKSNQITPGVLRGEPYWDNQSYLGGPFAGLSTQVTVDEIDYTKTQTGTGYDAINKLSYPIYNYQTVYKQLLTQQIQGDQKGIAQFNFALTKNTSYKFTFSSVDAYGRKIVDQEYVYGGGVDNSYYFSPDTTYSLYNLDKKQSYKIGDAVNLRLQTFEGTVLPERADDYIFLIVNNGTIEYKLQNTPTLTTTFRDKDVPNIGVWPGWFSNGRFHNSYLQNVSFDADERRLNIAVTADKQTYKPGDTVRLDVNIKDKNNNPVKAEVNLSAVDESVFSINLSEKDIVGDLYRDIYSQVLVRTSNVPPYGGGGAEKGGGDGDSPRSNLQELAIFTSIETDGSGHAHAEFKLPDNITSWRLTTQAVTKDLFAGKDTTFIPVTLPLFIDATLNTTYLTRDNLILRLRAFGTSLTTAPLSYTVQSDTLPFKKLTKVGGANVEFPLGTLTPGAHEMTMSVTNGSLSDALTRPLHVLSSYFTKNSSNFYEGVDGLKIKNNASGYTTLTFSSLGQGKLYDELKSLSYQWGMRLDQRGSAAVAENMLTTYFGEKNNASDYDADKYQGYNGGLQLLPYSSDDLTLSALAAHVLDPETFNKVELKNYFTTSLSDTKADASRITRALYGLTAFNEPVLTKIESIKKDKTLNTKDAVFVALALDAMGAKEEARTYYKEMIKPKIVKNVNSAYVGGLKGDDTTTTTALVAALTARLDEPESEQLFAYAQDNRPRETVSNFERLLYVKTALPKLDSQDVSFSFKAGSKEGSKTVKKGEAFALTLSPQELAAFELSNVKGKLGIVASFEESSTPASIAKDRNLTLSRSYQVNGVVTKQFTDGDLVLIQLVPQFNVSSLSGPYQIVDYLPSGLRAADQEAVQAFDNYSARVYPSEINDQKVTFVVDKATNSPIYYYARVVSKGTYKAEPAILQSLRNFDSVTLSNEDSITVK